MDLWKFYYFLLHMGSAWLRNKQSPCSTESQNQVGHFLTFAILPLIEFLQTEWQKHGKFHVLAKLGRWFTYA